MKNAIQLITAGALSGTMLVGVSGSAAEVNCSALQPNCAERILEKMNAKTFTDSYGTKLNYRIYKSPAYNATDKNKPAVLFVYLHGAGGSGNDNEQQIKDQSALVNYLASDSAEKVLSSLPYIVIAPQCPVGFQWVETPYSQGSYSIEEIPLSKNLNAVYELIQSIAKHENVDKGNIMLNGISMGGYGTWDLALRYPKAFKAIAPICGGGDPTKAQRLEGMRIWAFHCDGDQSVPVSGSRDMINALETAGVAAKYTEFAINGHNAWKPALEDVKDPSMIEWLINGISYNVSIESECQGTACQEISLYRGQSLTVDILPAKGYKTARLYIDGLAVSPVEKYCFENVAAPHSIKAVFEKLPQ